MTLPSSGTDTLDYSKQDADTEREEEESVTLTDPTGYSYGRYELTVCECHNTRHPPDEPWS